MSRLTKISNGWTNLQLLTMSQQLINSLSLGRKATWFKRGDKSCSRASTKSSLTIRLEDQIDLPHLWMMLCRVCTITIRRLNKDSRYWAAQSDSEASEVTQEHHLWLRTLRNLSIRKENLPLYSKWHSSETSRQGSAATTLTHALSLPDTTDDLKSIQRSEDVILLFRSAKSFLLLSYARAFNAN